MTDFFSNSYAEARRRFRQAAQSSGAALDRYSIGDSDHTIDVATLGSSAAEHVLLISSGVHGVEGFPGSAIQLAWLEQTDHSKMPPNLRVVLVHAINPFGFANLRRCNEDNVDLNRNFHDESSHYRGSPERYAEFESLLNPRRPVRGWDTFRISAVGAVLRYGLPALKATIAGGQYDYPEGLFFGGHGPCASTRVIQSQVSSWIGQAGSVLHVDLHTGLGRFSDCQLLLVQNQQDPDFPWYQTVYGADRIEPLAGADGIAYSAAGLMGAWLRRKYADRCYRFVTAEFGTYYPLRVLAAMRRENQAHFYNDPADRRCQRAKQELLECFCPRNQRWREQVVQTGLQVINESIAGMKSSSRSDLAP